MQLGNIFQVLRVPIGESMPDRNCDGDSSNMSFAANVSATPRVLPHAMKEHGKRYA